ncbi:hypothetical protein M2283_005724 [Streptomyces pseudovenezuelae]|uniref:Uncharacterized protein n=1 Tax=Streptomyces pseudovenezuelae TaxID=67350 RepID=A0ABT6LQ08_9ACTN|nr:glycosyltransferase 87 family protein [Streptomyces pseudovenezuelae]MDH6218392.1 hypothetical protein [Streptomyces pseudovenezuelae]
MADALVYRAEGAAVAHGGDLYGFTVTRRRLPATYPPFAALLFVPLSWLPVPVVKAVLLAGNALLLVWFIHLSARLAGRPLPVPALFASRTMWLLPQPHAGDLDLRLPWWAQPLVSPYPPLGLALLGSAFFGKPAPFGRLAQLSSASSSSASMIRYAYPCSARKRWRWAAKSWSRVSRATTE